MVAIRMVLGLSLLTVLLPLNVWASSLQSNTRCLYSADCTGNTACSNQEVSICTLSGNCICHRYHTCDDCYQRHICKGHQALCFTNVLGSYCTCGGSDSGWYNDTGTGANSLKTIVANPSSTSTKLVVSTINTTSTRIPKIISISNTMASQISTTNITRGSTATTSTVIQAQSAVVNYCNHSLECKSQLCASDEIPICKYDRTCNCLHPHYCKTKDDCTNFNCTSNQQATCALAGCLCHDISHPMPQPTQKVQSHSAPQTTPKAQCVRSTDCWSNRCSHHEIPYCRADQSCGCLSEHHCKNQVCGSDGCHCEHLHHCKKNEDCVKHGCPHDQNPICRSDGCHCEHQVPVIHQSQSQGQSCNSSIVCRSNYCDHNGVPYCKKDRTCGCLPEHTCYEPDDCTNKQCPHDKVPACRDDGCHCAKEACYSSDDCHIYCHNWENPVCTKEGCHCYNHKDCHECYKTICRNGQISCFDYHHGDWAANCTCQTFTTSTSRYTPSQVTTTTASPTITSSTFSVKPSIVHIGSVNINVSPASSSGGQQQLSSSKSSPYIQIASLSTSSPTSSAPSSTLGSATPSITPASASSSDTSKTPVPSTSPMSSTSSSASTSQPTHYSLHNSTTISPSVMSIFISPTTTLLPTTTQTTLKQTTQTSTTTFNIPTSSLVQQINTTTSPIKSTPPYSTINPGGSTTNVARLPGFSEKNSHCDTDANCTRSNTYISFPFGPILCSGSEQSPQCIQGRCYCKQIQLITGPLCQQCGDINSRTPCQYQDVFLGKPTPCRSGQYCQTDIRTENNSNKEIYKRCVDEKTCIRDWLMQSSDKEYCVRYGQVTKTDTYVCSFCCVGDDCNTGLLPKNSTLYGSRGP